MKEAEVHELFRDALVHNRLDFIKLYLENGFNLKAYLTHAELTYLYNQVRLRKYTIYYPQCIVPIWDILHRWSLLVTKHT